MSDHPVKIWATADRVAVTFNLGPMRPFIEVVGVADMLERLARLSAPGGLSGDPRRVRLVRANYNNPLEFIVVVGGGVTVLMRFLVLLRDWKAKQELALAESRIKAEEARTKKLSNDLLENLISNGVDASGLIADGGGAHVGSDTTNLLNLVGSLETFELVTPLGGTSDTQDPS